MITQEQRAAVKALALPFALSDTDIAKQFEADGTPIARDQRKPMARVRDLARDAMETQTVTQLAA